MPRGKLLTEFERGQIQAFRSENVGIRDISRRIGRSDAAVRTYLRDPENYGKNMGGKRRSAVSVRDKRAILREISNKATTIARVKNDLQLNASKSTIWRVVSTSENIRHAQMKKKPKLTDENKLLRLQWGEEHVRQRTDWSCIVFSDEKKFNLDGPDRYHCYWHDLRKDELLCSNRVHGGGSVMVWGCFGFGGLRVAMVSGRMNSADYVEMLGAELLPFAHELGGENWHFQQDNAPIHTSAESRQWFAANDIRLVSHPAKSPDLNPMENVWGMIARIVYGGGKQYESVAELVRAIENAVFDVDICQLQHLSETMCNRIFEIIQNRGSYTSY